MIDFTFTEEQEMFRKAAREFSETKVAPKVSEMEATGEVCDEVVQALGEAEMMALTIPEKYGGLGLGYIARLISLEEISRVSKRNTFLPWPKGRDWHRRLSPRPQGGQIRPVSAPHIGKKEMIIFSMDANALLPTLILPTQLRFWPRTTKIPKRFQPLFLRKKCKDSSLPVKSIN